MHEANRNSTGLVDELIGQAQHATELANALRRSNSVMAQLLRTHLQGAAASLREAAKAAENLGDFIRPVPRVEPGTPGTLATISGLRRWNVIEGETPVDGEPSYDVRVSGGGRMVLVDVAPQGVRSGVEGVPAVSIGVEIDAGMPHVLLYGRGEELQLEVYATPAGLNVRPGAGAAGLSIGKPGDPVMGVHEVTRLLQEAIAAADDGDNDGNGEAPASRMVG